MLLESRKVKLNTRVNIEVRRTIPHKQLRTIGAFCFVDYFGPTEQTDAMVVAAHPHTGLQTVTWLFEGEVEHRDSIGSIQTIKPGQLNLMTAGRGISHSEVSRKTEGNLHGIQLWVALDDNSRKTDPEFEHIEQSEIVETDSMKARVFMGSMLGVESKAKIFSDLVAAEIDLEPGEHRIALNPEFEYGLLLIVGDALVSGDNLNQADLMYFPKGDASMQITANIKAKVVLIGGVPFEERLVMWWNFIARSHEEIQNMREMWNDEQHRMAGDDNFGVFKDDIGGWIPAPDMPNLQLRSRGQLG